MVEVNAVFVTEAREAGGFSGSTSTLSSLPSPSSLNSPQARDDKQTNCPPSHHQHMPTAMSAHRKLSVLAKKTLRWTFV